MSAVRIAVVSLVALLANVHLAGAHGGLRGFQKEKTAEAAARPSESSIAETLASFDVNGDGKVSREEIDKFAQSQGLSPEEVRADFKDLDRNGNGELEPSELSASLGEMESAQQLAPVTPPLQRHQVELPAVKPEQMPLAAKPMAAKPVAAKPVEATPTSPLTMAAAAIAGDANSDAASVLIETPLKQQSGDDLNVANMQMDAERQAGRLLAEVVARRAGEMFQQGLQDKQRAVSFEKLAKELRSKMTAVARSASTETKQAARQGISDVTGNAIKEVHRLKSEAEKAERDAALRQRGANEAMQRVLKAQAEMVSSSRFLS